MHLSMLLKGLFVMNHYKKELNRTRGKQRTGLAPQTSNGTCINLQLMVSTKEPITSDFISI